MGISWLLMMTMTTDRGLSSGVVDVIGAFRFLACKLVVIGWVGG